jgi:hypothetical protein
MKRYAAQPQARCTIQLRRTDRPRARPGALDGEAPYPIGIQKPTTRADCLPGGPNQDRPCPFVSCRYHLFLEAKPNGNIRINQPDREVAELEHSCCLDVADDGGATLVEVGKLLRISKERVRQISEGCMVKLARSQGARELLRIVTREASWSYETK